MGFLAEDEEDGPQPRCLHCALMQAIAAWATANGHVDEDGIAAPDADSIAKGLGEVIADVTAMTPNAQAAGDAFREIMRHAQDAFPSAREFYRNADAKREQASGNIHGMLVNAVLKGKPN